MKGIILLIAAIIVTVIVTPFAMIFGFYKKFYKTTFKKAWADIDTKLINMAVSVDKFGNVVAAELFNAILIKNSTVLFGDHRQTISNVLGRNFLTGTLTCTGRLLNKILNFIDKNHAVKSIESE